MQSDDIRLVESLATQLRADSIRCSTSAGSGHPTSSMSAADLLAVLVTRHLRYDWSRPKLPGNDHLIFSKGHASPLLYSVFKAVGVVSDEELMTGYRRAGHRLQGHPTPILPWVDVATGSLGQGLPVGVGVALAARRLDHTDAHVWVLGGDSEMTEGSFWEALDRAAVLGLGNITLLADVNRLGQRGPTELGWDLEAYAARVKSFGWHPLVIDGHDVTAIDEAMTAARGSEVPVAILAKTVKGKGFSKVADKEGWHGKPLPPDLAKEALAELNSPDDLTVTSPLPENTEPAAPRPPVHIELPAYKLGERVATRKAYGDALAAVGANPRVVALDAEVGNSTFSDIFGKAYPDRFFEMYIAEQQLVSAAIGLGVRGYAPFASTFAAFFSRAYDFLRMTGISGVGIKLCGSHAGVEIGPDGPSQMALEDLASIRAVHGSTVLYPCDAVSTAKLVSEMVDREGVVYMRSTRGAYPVLYGPDEQFPIGGSKTLRSSDSDDLTLVGAGVTLHTCLGAADELAAQGITCRVIDAYSVKPIDGAALADAAQTGLIVVAEDHYPQGGIGSAVLESLSGQGITCPVTNLAVTELPGSGAPEEMLEIAGISAPRIAARAREALARLRG
jgi:transketolase